MPNEGARKTADAKIVSMAPDVCWTPAPNGKVPVPYPITAVFSDSVQISSNVRFGGDPVFICGQSTISKVTGDQAGSLNGLVSNTVGSKAEPILGSLTVKANGKMVIRNGDMFKMNNGNTVGKVVYQPAAAPACSINNSGKPSADTNPPVEPETPEEEAFLKESKVLF